MTILPVHGIGEVRAGDDLAELILGAADLRVRDIVVVAQKVVSKAEGAVVTVPDGARIADARLDLARTQARRIVADAPGVLVVETVHGLVCANAGIDASNAEPSTLLLLPDDPDASAAGLRRGIHDRTGLDVGVVITDTFGRPWRAGQTDVAIGIAGVAAIRDERSPVDRAGRPLEVTQVAVVDEIAAAADLARRKADGVPVCIVRGLDWDIDDDARARQLVRPAAQDHFLRGRGRLAAALADPEPLRALDETALDRAVAQVRAVLPRAAALDVTWDDERWCITPLGGDVDGAAAGEGLRSATATLLAALLADSGYPASLVVEPEPRVHVARSGADGGAPAVRS